MKKLINIFAALLFLSAVNIIAQEEDYSKYAGFANFGDLSALEDGEMVTEILIEEKLLKMVAKFTNDDEDLSSLMSGLKLIKVNTFEVTATNAEELKARANSIDKDLMKKNWDRIVKTKSKGEIANVYIKTAGEEEFVGLTVVSIDENGEAAFVNIVGNIDMDTLGKLGQKFDIPGIGDIQN